MKVLQYNLVLYPEPEGGYTVSVPALPGCITYGKTLAKAKAMAMDAISAYLVSLQKHGDRIPTDEGSFITSLSISSPLAFA